MLRIHFGIRMDCFPECATGRSGKITLGHACLENAQIRPPFHDAAFRADSVAASGPGENSCVLNKEGGRGDRDSEALLEAAEPIYKKVVDGTERYPRKTRSNPWQ